MNINSLNLFTIQNYFLSNTPSFSSITKKISTIAMYAFGLYLGFCACRYFYYNRRKIEDGQNKTIDFFGYVSEGEFKNGQLNGQGKRERFVDTAEGEFKDGQLNGQGKISFWLARVDKEGEFKDGKLNGQGKIVSRRNRRNTMEGEFRDGFLQRGKWTMESLQTEEGEFKGLKLHGQGKRTHHQYYIQTEEGEFNNGHLHGNGKRTYRNGTLEDGTFEHGQFITG